MLISQNTYEISTEQKAAKLYDLELFKMLLQPHFLFNSLNNLYALSIKKSDQTSEAIAGLSELLEKIVSYSREEVIPLQNEIDLIKDYIKLERIWLGETSFVLDLQVSGDINEIKVPPLVLYTFVENCFKHGIRRCENQGWLTIKIEVRKDGLSFSTRNQLPEWDTESGDNGRKGLGVIAAKELLENKCSGRFILHSGRRGNIYEVDLEISSTK